VTGNNFTSPQVTESDPEVVISPEVIWKWLEKPENSHILYISLPTRL